MPPLGCILKEGERWKIEEWLEQIMKDKDRQKEVRPPEHPMSLVTTIRSSSEEKERRRQEDQRDRGTARTVRKEARQEKGGPRGEATSQHRQGEPPDSSSQRRRQDPEA